jgi:DNA replication and repair protein RecF
MERADHAGAGAARLGRLELTDFRCFARARLELATEGTTVITGRNGSGKTTLLEAVAYLGTRRSFRGVPVEVMVRSGCARAVLRADLRRDGRPLSVEAELAVAGRSRLLVNRQAVSTRRALAGLVPVTVFSPDDLAIVQEGPARRRDLLDDALALLDPAVPALIDEVERVLRQRAALLRQAGGRLSAEVELTLAVWDDRLDVAGTALVAARRDLVDTLGPYAAGAYHDLATREAPSGAAAAPLQLTYRQSWAGALAEALRANRPEDLRRAATGTGPHRDDLVLTLGGRAARHQASQGEQRCVALALRLALHRLVTDRVGEPPILLLDDVFSELDPERARALVRRLPPGQALLTTAAVLPPDLEVARVVDVATVTGPFRDADPAGCAAP